MSMLDKIVFTLGLLSVIPYMCRIDSLKIGDHKLAVFAFHVGLFLGCLWAASEAWYGDTDTINVIALTTGYLWIWMSHSTWRHGPPDHVRRHKTTVQRSKSSDQQGFIS